MSTVTRVGAAWALCHEDIAYDPLRGAQYIRVYETDEAGLLSLPSPAWYERFEIDRSDAPKVRVTIYSPTDDDAPIFELLANYKEKDLLEHPSAKGISLSNVATLIKAIRTPSTTPPTFTGSGAEQTLASQFYKLMFEGTRKYAVEDYVLRYTVTATNSVQLNLAYANTDKLFTPLQIADPGVSGIILPAGIAASMGNIPAQGPLTDHLWSWLKRAPTARQTQYGKVVVTGEWWLQLWSTIIYAPVA